MKKIPERMCIACRSVVPKSTLVRIVKNSDGEIFLDFTGKAAGRGAYLCDKLECIDKCIKTKALNRAFEINVDKEVYEKIRGEYVAKKQG